MPAPPELAPAPLADVVTRALGRAVTPLEWRVDAIHTPFNQATRGLYRVTGTASDGGVATPWSVVVKVVQSSDDPFGGRDDPAHPNYWEREPRVYASGMLDDLPGLRAPRCFRADRRGDGSAWLWLEDVPNGAARWTPVDFRTAARQLGTFNGAWLASRALPRHDFLSRDWLRAFVGEFAPAYVRLTRSATLRRHPLVRRCWPDGLFDRTLALWADRDGLLATLDAVPHTFCHLDAFSRNLVVGPAGVIALDWAFAGIAPLGAELAPLVAASVIYGDAEPEALRDLDALAFDAYLDGLREAGWRGDVRVVRLGFAATVALRYGLFPLGVHLANVELRERLERSLRRDACDVARRWARISAYLLDRLDETRPPR